MVKVDEAVVAKYKFENKTFEILVDCEKALEVRDGNDIDMSDVLATKRVFSDSAKGLAASEHDFERIFKTKDLNEVAKQIIRKGEVQLTAEHRKKVRETKRRQIIDIIHRNGIDPRTNLPHPLQRIENAIEEAKVHIDENKGVEKQVDEILKKIRVVLPIKFALKEIAVKVAGKFAGKARPLVASFGKILRDDWQTDGSWIVVVEIPGGLEEDFTDKINNLTHGETLFKVLKTY